MVARWGSLSRDLVLGPIRGSAMEIAVALDGHLGGYHTCSSAVHAHLSAGYARKGGSSTALTVSEAVLD